jgi:hypothetical protein
MASLDSQYNPGGQAINGVAPTQFFDNIVLDAISIGSGLMDAGDPAFVSNAGNVPGETLISEPSDSGNSNVGGTRVAINYNGLLLNAPHVHSRYYGNLTGVIIADVAFLARNPSANIFDEVFNYDPTFNSVQYVFPALTTTILSLQK